MKAKGIAVGLALAGVGVFALNLDTAEPTPEKVEGCAVGEPVGFSARHSTCLPVGQGTPDAVARTIASMSGYRLGYGTCPAGTTLIVLRAQAPGGDENTREYMCAKP